MKREGPISTLDEIFEYFYSFVNFKKIWLDRRAKLHLAICNLYGVVIFATTLLGLL